MNKAIDFALFILYICSNQLADNRYDIYKNKDIKRFFRHIFMCLEEWKWGGICKDFTPFCLIYSCLLSELSRISFIINVRPVYNKLFHYLLKMQNEFIGILYNKKKTV